MTRTTKALRQAGILAGWHPRQVNSSAGAGTTFCHLRGQGGPPRGGADNTLGGRLSWRGRKTRECQAWRGSCARDHSAVGGSK